ncbi:MurR/RpiR family transcriptional regulator [Streptomyces sp. RB6PN25]|uniref:MurR/RpiR family transcriptional regulator n=1 Tax=Streptomyces humicola TaxID=2953240 RepID=A0ABT1PXY0_9ACTN|nr:MurR/RpiR family transcriptional regulator [Streptomyces humicola]MCQ4082526.1 MurR/RpiR family transcriptional regulator [Streptomyces humicola]
MQTFDDLATALRERSGKLSPAQKRLAERVMSDPEGVAFMTVTELAATVGVNESTVVRFATSLGLDGYPGLTRLCRERLREQAQLLRRFSQLEAVTGDVGRSRDPLELAMAFDQANIARSLARVDRDSWAEAAKALSSAPRVHVLGLRKCHAPAYLLGYLLRMLRDDVATVPATAGMLTDDLRRVRAGDCFVGIAIHRYSADTVRGFHWAKRQGATTIALTDNQGSPLVPDADQSFFIDTAGVSVLRSMTAFTSLVQALATEVATELGAEARSRLLGEEELLGFLGVYTSGQAPDRT